MAYQFPLNGGRINATIGGNTAGAGSLVSTGTLTLVGGNNVTLSQAGNAITISGGGGSINFSAGTTSNNLAAVTFANSNGIGFGLNGSTITASHNGLTSQSVQSQQIIQGLVGGTATSTASTGTVTFANANGVSFGMSGNTMTASVAAGGGGGIAAANSQTTYTSGTVRFVEGSGAITINSSTNGASQSLRFNVPAVSTLSATGAVSLSTNGSVVSIGVPMFQAGVSNSVAGGTTGGNMAINNSGQVALYAGTNIGLSQSTAAGGNASITISGAGGGGGAATLSRWQNMDRGTSTFLPSIPYNTLFLQRLNQENDLFAGNMTVSTMLLNMSGSASTGASSTQTIAAFTTSVSIGIYQPVASNNSVLTIINSASTSWGSNATQSIYPLHYGNRWISLHSSQWSSVPAFSANQDYVLGVLFRSSGTSTAMSMIGQNYMNSQTRSGFMGVSTTTGNNTMPHGNYWNAVYTASASSFPGGISANQVNRNNATAIFIPHVIFNNQYTY